MPTMSLTNQKGFLELSEGRTSLISIKKTIDLSSNGLKSIFSIFDDSSSPGVVQLWRQLSDSGKQDTNSASAFLSSQAASLQKQVQQAKIENKTSIDVEFSVLLGTDKRDILNIGANTYANGLDGNDVLMGGGDNYLVGGAGDDRLHVARGVNILEGGAGNDAYFILGGENKVIEGIDGGNDTVYSTHNYNYRLTDHVENLTLLGTAKIGLGNSANNIINGSSVDNMLCGFAGNDTLDGRSGADVLSGGLGDDTYLFGVNGGKDTIIEQEGMDTLVFGKGINAEQLLFKHISNDLVVTRIGTEDSIRITSWYSASNSRDYHIEIFKSGDGKTLSENAVNGLVDAMANYEVQAGATTLLLSSSEELNTVFAASWK